MIIKMTLITTMYVGLTYFLWDRLKDREITVPLRLGIGLIYGICSILSTHYGVDFGSMLLNVRDLGPMSAGLFLDPVSGIIAGLIGGIERYIAGTYFGIASFTRIACSISTCLAGFLAAFFHIYIFGRKKPSVTYAFFIGAVIEVFHMYVVFITHRDDMDMAFYVVKICSVPMIIFSGLGLAAISLVIRIGSGEWHNPFVPRESRDVPVSFRFQIWLFGVTAVVLITNFFFNYSLQTNMAVQNAKKQIDVAEEDIEDTYKKLKAADEDCSFISNRIGGGGAFYIFDGRTLISSSMPAEEVNEEEVLETMESHTSGSFFSFELAGEGWLGRIRFMDDRARLFTMLSDASIFESRDIQAYETFLADILLFTVIYVLISLLVQRIVVDDLVRVNESLNKITDGDLDEKIRVYNSSEFATLSDDINLTVDVLKGYIDAAEKRMEQELLLAHTIQESALPKIFEFNHRGFELFATMDPAKEVGGDFYDFFFVEKDHLALVIADVSGKGIPAALFMMHSKTAIRSLAETGSSPAEVLYKVNNELCEGNEADMFVTVWMGVIDLGTGIMNCVNAGHEYPSIMRKGGYFELFKEKHGLPLGAMEGVPYKEYRIKLEPGDCLFVYTDGVPEAINESEEQYGTDRMLKALNKYRDSSMETLLAGVKSDQDEFAGAADQFDDTTMLGFRYRGPQK